LVARLTRGSRRRGFVVASGRPHATLGFRAIATKHRAIATKHAMMIVRAAIFCIVLHSFKSIVGCNISMNIFLNWVSSKFAPMIKLRWI
jgi:hypothetical protein